MKLEYSITKWSIRLGRQQPHAISMTSYRWSINLKKAYNFGSCCARIHDKSTESYVGAAHHIPSFLHIIQPNNHDQIRKNIDLYHFVYLESIQ